MKLLIHFRFALFFSFICLALAASWGFNQSGINGLVGALTICLILSVMEVSLSFDNAVVNASVLKEMSAFWQQLFLTVGILIAVFGMRLVFPVLLVAIVTDQGMIEVMNMALERPHDYAAALLAHHLEMAAFGGSFLLMVWLDFMFDGEREHKWLGTVERPIGRLGNLRGSALIAGLVVLAIAYALLPISQEKRQLFAIAGLIGIALYVSIDFVAGLFEPSDGGGGTAEAVKRAGLNGFIYLEILDAAFSFDGVIGAFAITRDIVIIMLGLAIGAVFVRSITIYLVRLGTLEQYIYLEHGAHYAIGALALIMFLSTWQHVPEIITGLIGVAFIAAALVSSVRYNRLHRLEHPASSNQKGGEP